MNRCLLDSSIQMITQPFIFKYRTVIRCQSNGITFDFNILKIVAMDATINQNNQPQQISTEKTGGKSELMQFFESQLNDMYWAYKDLLRAIAEIKD